MAKLPYTKDEMELLILKQLENLDTLGEQIKLLKKQNELLLKFNHKLIEELSDRTPPVPYIIKRRKTSKDNRDEFRAKD